jgi:hypothetical protein
VSSAALTTDDLAAALVERLQVDQGVDDDTPLNVAGDVLGRHRPQ